MNVNLRGATKQVLDIMIEKGFAATQSEAIRLAVFWFGQNKLEENELAAKKMAKIHAQIKSGKHKVVSAKKAAKMYPELKKLS
ncbi:Uncharacterised protein [uncultured archaeon]|nr:Uncharacterised protein [uncultured archaeon]